MRYGLCDIDKHSFIADLDGNAIRCRNCPLVISKLELLYPSNSREFIKNARRIEREWYIKELES